MVVERAASLRGSRCYSFCEELVRLLLLVIMPGNEDVMVPVFAVLIVIIHCGMI